MPATAPVSRKWTRACCRRATSRCASSHSTVNYKDGLAITGKAPVVRRCPMIAGIDFAGVGRAPATMPASRPATRVMLNGWGVGETHFGGYAQMARVKGDWLVKMPAGLTTRAGHGHRHRRLHRHAVRAGAGAPRRRRRRAAPCSSPAPPAASAASPSRCWPSSATGSSPRPGGRRGRLPQGPRRRRGDRARRTCRRPASRSARSAGPASSIRSAATRWPTPAPAHATAARSRPAAWRRAWTFRPRWRPSSCAA